MESKPLKIVKLFNGNYVLYQNVLFIKSTWECIVCEVKNMEVANEILENLNNKTMTDNEAKNFAKLFGDS